MQKRERSVVPIYAMGVIVVIYSLIFPMYRIGDLLMAFWIAVLSFMVFNKIFPGTVVEVEISTGDAAVDRTLATGREYMNRLDDLRIQDPEVNRRISEMQRISRQIFDHIAKNPSQVRKINTFMDYYYPTVLKFLEHYAEYDSKGIKGGNIQSTMEKIRGSLASFEAAFAHQLDNLYSDKALDIEGDVAVLESIIKQEGLMGDTAAKTGLGDAQAKGGFTTGGLAGDVEVDDHATK